MTTNTQDLTAPEAVERIAQHYDADIEGCDPECAATLRALSAKLEAAEARLKIQTDRLNIALARNDVQAMNAIAAADDLVEIKRLMAERDALKAELAEAVGFIQHVADGHPKDYSDNMDRARALRARHQKEADT